jgi:hypothetical protein
LEIDTAKVQAALAAVTQGSSTGIDALSQDERTVLIQYYNVFQSFSTNNTEA